MSRYPHVSTKVAQLTYKYHSSHTTNCGWSKDDTVLVTVGGTDRCVFKWRHFKEDVATREQAEMAGASGNESGLINEGVPSFAGTGGGGAMDAKPWVGSIAAPSAPPAY